MSNQTKLQQLQEQLNQLVAERQSKEIELRLLKAEIEQLKGKS